MWWGGGPSKFSAHSDKVRFTVGGGQSIFCLGINYICFVPRRLPVIRWGPKHQHKNNHSCPKYHFYHTRPIVSRGCGSCLWIALGRFMFCNEYSWPIHALCDVTIRIQNAWRHNADACCHNSSRLATATSDTPLPCRVPLNGMFHQESTTQWNKLPIWKICNYE